MAFASLPFSQYVAKKVAVDFARFDRRALKADHAIADRLVKNFTVALAYAHKWVENTFKERLLRGFRRYRKRRLVLAITMSV